MFTGIIHHCGKLLAIDAQPKHTVLRIASQFKALVLGESITVDGACLTVTEIFDEGFACELSPETLKLTIASNYQVGDLVNLERALSLQDRMGGHWVSGHVDAVAQVEDIKKQAEFKEIIIKNISKDCLAYLVKKGSVTLNGVSLTINKVFDDGLSLMLIPHTLSNTNLGVLKNGNQVNIEYDYLAKLVARQLELSGIVSQQSHAREQVESCFPTEPRA